MSGSRDSGEVFNITAEVRQLARVKKIQDELTIILRVLKDQKEVLTAMTAKLGGLDSKLLPSNGSPDSIYKQRHQMVDANIRDFKEMQTHANVVHDEVRDQVFISGRS
jgi:ABC-type sugar transport system ATPase subunit